MTRRITGGEKPPGWDDNPIGQLDYMTQARRALGLQRSMQGHVDPNFNISVQADDFTREEMLWLRRGLLCEFGTSVAAVALANGILQLRNSAGTVAVVTQLRFLNLSAGPTTYSWGITTPTGGLTTAFAQMRDQRAQAATNACVPQFGTEVGALGGSGGRVTVAVNETKTVPCLYVLTGANLQCLRIVCETVNIISQAHITWWERPQGPQET